MIPSFLIIHHTATERDKTSFEAVKQNHINLGWGDIGYHYFITPRKVHKGRAEDIVGAHCKADGMNFKSLGICLTGNFQTEEPTGFQVSELEKLTKELRERYQIVKENILAHKEVAGAATACPGNNLMPIIKEIRNGEEKVATQKEMDDLRNERDENHNKYITMKDIAEDWERKYKTEKAERESYDNFIVRIAQRLNCPAKTPDIEGVIQGLIEREDSEIKLKKEMETLNGQIKTIGIEKDELIKRVNILLGQLKAQEEVIQRLTGAAITDLTAKELFVLWFRKWIGR